MGRKRTKPVGSTMTTTIEWPIVVWQETKRIAKAQGITARQLVIQATARELVAALERGVSVRPSRSKGRA